MDEATRVLNEAPISCLEDDDTPRIAEDFPAKSRDPPTVPQVATTPEPRRRASPLDVPVAVARSLEAHRPMAHAVVKRMGVRARDAPDVVQRLLIALLPKWEERQAWPASSRANYVAGAARIVARRYLGRVAFKAEVLVEAGPLRKLQERAMRAVGEAPSAEDILVSEELWVERAGDTPLDFLRESTAPANWRVFHAYFMLGMPTSMIAKMEDAPVPTIYNRLRLARRDLRAAISRFRARNRNR